MNERGARYNSAKLRYELVPHYPLSELVKVYTKGAHKYSQFRDADGNILLGTQVTQEQVMSQKLERVYDAAYNWRKGLSWMETMAAVERHIAEWKALRDIDEELGTLHLANAAWGLFTLIEFSQTYRQGDDRPLRMVTPPRIGLDIDEVLADFTMAWHERWPDMDPRPISWYYDREMVSKFESMKAAGELDEFFLGLKPKIEPKDIPFEPKCYVTSRPVDSSVTEKWLAMHGFPQVKVITVGHGNKKSEVLKSEKIDIFVDDSFENFMEINAAGVLCLLWDAPHNARYPIGSRRIKSMKEIVDYEKIYGK